jgi:hypothetical protein
MAYNQKKPTFFGSALKQYTATHGETGETKTFESKEEYHNFKSDDSGTGWTKQAKGLASVELSQDNYNKSKTDGNLNILNKNIENLSPEDKKIYDRIKADESPLHATAGFNILMAGAGKDGTNKYTSGDRSYRGNWDVDFMTSAFNPSEDDVIEKDGGGKDPSGGGDPPSNSSSTISWPPNLKKSNNRKQNNYATTSCQIIWDKHGKQTNKFTNLTKKQQRKIKRGQVGGI